MKRELRRGIGRRTEDLPQDLLLVLTMLWDEQVRLSRIRTLIYVGWEVDLTESRISYICTHHLRRSMRYKTSGPFPARLLDPKLAGERRRQNRGPIHERRTGLDRREPASGVQVACMHCSARFRVFDFDLPTPCPTCGTVRVPASLERKIS